MIVIDQILIVGVSVYGFHMATVDTVFIEQALEHRHNGIGGTGSRGNNLALRGNLPIVDTEDNIRNIVAGGGSQQNL